MVPPPRRVTIDRLLGDPISLLGYAPETTIAEKGVTILERGITSTRWRDYVDTSNSPAKVSTPTRCFARHGRSPATAASRSNPLRTTSPVKVQSDKRNGPFAARKSLSRSAKRTSTNRSTWSSASSIPSSSTVPNRRRDVRRAPIDSKPIGRWVPDRRASGSARSPSAQRQGGESCCLDFFSAAAHQLDRDHLPVAAVGVAEPPRLLPCCGQRRGRQPVALHVRDDGVERLYLSQRSVR